MYILSLKMYNASMARKNNTDDLSKMTDTLDIMLLFMAAGNTHAKPEDARKWLDQAFVRVQKISASYDKKVGFFARMAGKLRAKKNENEQHSSEAAAN